MSVVTRSGTNNLEGRVFLFDRDDALDAQNPFSKAQQSGQAPFDEQRAWVEQDLAAHARGKRVVVLMHQPMNVPFGSPSQYDAYEDLLERYDTELILVGHEHSNDVDQTSFVRGVIARRKTSTRASCEGGGTGKESFVRTIPSRRTRWSHVVSIRP